MLGTAGRVVRALVAVAAAALVCPAATAAGGRSVLLYGPGLPGAEAEEAARSQAAAYLRGVKRAEPAVHVSEVAFFGPAPLWVIGDVQVRPCSGASRRTDEIRSLVERGKEQTDMLEQAEADETFRSAWLALECAGDLVSEELLYEVHFYSGISAYVAGDRQRARSHFAQAISTDPDRPFDPGYAPEIETLYEEARRQRSQGGAASLDLRDPERAMSAVWLDGRPVTGEDGLRLTTGHHLLQFRTRFGTFTSMQLLAEGLGRAVLVSREGMAAALMDPGTDRAARAVATAALRQLAEHHDASAVVASLLGDAWAVYRFDSASSIVHVIATHETGAGPTDTPDGTVDGGEASARDGRSSHPRAHPRRAGLSVSGGLFFHPVAGLNAAQATYGAVGLQGEIPIVSGLAVDLGLWIAFRDAGPTSDGDARWMYVLPSLRSGLHISLASGPVRPYVGGAFHLALHETRDRWGQSQGAAPAPGGVGIVGLAVEATDHLRFHVDFHAGGGTALVLQVTGGAGFRF